MDLNIEINRLSRAELAYELACRGVTETLSMELGRKTLRGLLKLTKSTSYVAPPYPFTFAEDATAVTAKLEEIETLLGSVTVGDEGLLRKIVNKLAHVSGRANRAVPTTEEETASRSGWLVKIVAMMARYQERVEAKRLVRTIADPVIDLSVVQPQAQSSRVQDDSLTESESDSEFESAMVENTSETLKPIPVRQWGLTFSGDPSKISLAAFLERVDELRGPRNVSKTLLFRSALDLFSGNALIWYRANRRSFSSWDDLVAGLREQFQAADYNERLF